MRRRTVTVCAALLCGSVWAQSDVSVLRGTVGGWTGGPASLGLLLEFPGGDDRLLQAARGTVSATGEWTLPLPGPERLTGSLVPLAEWLVLEPLGCVTRTGKVTFSDSAATVFPLGQLHVAPSGRSFPSVGSIVGVDLWNAAAILKPETNLLKGQPDAAGRVRVQHLVFSPSNVTVRGEVRCVPELGMPEAVTVDLPLKTGWNVVQEEASYSSEEAARTLTLAAPDTVTVWK
ncbi:MULTISPECIES: hypothetical protein [unclassified Deinococcus]|uniref:hypothetical protein n=1 Tax=unclassified Deinococcus TaxID=2623546 RepID=UPI001C8A1FD5|nr:MULTISPECIES: hypothetical protein [unclassified Deinococcus]MBX8467130.1 hypothetical protein [Deinococcus sp. RIT780]MCD0158836.1 hypothetical protein [Deinococcus sp. 6GRE01]